MYAITNWKELGSYQDSDAIKISERFDPVIVVSELPQGYSHEQLGEDLGVQFVKLHKLDNEKMITTDTQNDVVIAAVETLAETYKGHRKIHVTYDNNLVIDGATVILLRKQVPINSARASGLGFNVSTVVGFADSSASTTRGYLNDILLFHGTEKRIVAGCVLTSKTGHMWLINKMIEALDNPVKIKEDSSKIIKMIENMLDAKEKGLVERLKQADETIKSLQESLVEETRAFERIALSMEVLRSYGNDKKELAVKEIDSIANLHQVGRVFCNDTSVCIETKPIIATAKKTQIYIGRIAIEINIKNSVINMTPIDMAIEGKKAHPHSDPDGYGRLCLGSIKGDIASMIGRYELSSAFSLILAFAETFNPNDAWGATYNLWPRVENGKLVFPEKFKKEWLINTNIVEGMEV